MGKKPKDCRGTAQNERFALIFALPPVPHYEGRSTGKSSRISGAQNLSGFYRFIPGHWALALQKLMLVRFHLCAWLCRANALGSSLAVGAAPCGRPSRMVHNRSVGAARLGRPPSLPPPRGKVPPKGADEGDLLAAQAIPGGRPKGLPYPNQEDSWETCRAGACPRRLWRHLLP